MRKEADIPSKYGPSWSPSGPSLNVVSEKQKLLGAGFEFKSFKLVIAVIPIKHMYLQLLRKSSTGQVVF